MHGAHIASIFITLLYGQTATVTRRKHTHYIAYSASLLMLLPSVAAYGAEQSLAAITAAAEKFVIELTQHSPDIDLEIKAAPLDPRLKLAACSQPIAVYAPPGFRAMGNSNVGVRCEGAQRWNILLPVNVRAFANVLVTTHPLSRGTPIAENDIKLARREISNLTGGYITSVTDVIGHVTTQPLMMETVLSRFSVTSPPLVRRGEQVTIIASGDGIEIRSEGIAQQNGVLGATVTVSNTSSKRQIEGIVMAPGLIQVKI